MKFITVKHHDRSTATTSLPYSCSPHIRIITSQIKQAQPNLSTLETNRPASTSYYMSPPKNNSIASQTLPMSSHCKTTQQLPSVQGTKAAQTSQLISMPDRRIAGCCCLVPGAGWEVYVTQDHANQACRPPAPEMDCDLLMIQGWEQGHRPRPVSRTSALWIIVYYTRKTLCFLIQKAGDPQLNIQKHKSKYYKTPSSPTTLETNLKP